MGIADKLRKAAAPENTTKDAMRVMGWNWSSLNELLRGIAGQIELEHEELEEKARRINETDSRWEHMRGDLERMTAERDELKERIDELRTMEEIDARLENRLMESLEAMKETHIELPLDADGVPIRIGDSVAELDDAAPQKVVSLTYYEDCCDVNAYGMNPNFLRHVKPRTLEDILTDFYTQAKSECEGNFGDLHGELIPKYADEIREIMGGDA